VVMSGQRIYFDQREKHTENKALNVPAEYQLD
jgi:hypothetical protein